MAESSPTRGRGPLQNRMGPRPAPGAKPVRRGRVTLNLSAELFNVLNSGTALRRDGDARSSAFDRLDEVLSPRLLRLGARLAF